ncbi:MAG TPA: FUSC family protein, partial [Novosphingobium sp.]|nr:FUSC family protein [Novosphingobium sp.]
AWLLFGLTFVMIVLDKIDKPQVVLTHFAATRVAETLAGTVACVAVSLASAATLRRIWPAARPAAPTGAGWHPLALRHAAQGGTALVLLLAISSWLSLPALVQAAITIMAVMLVPVSAVGEGKVSMVSRRIWQRFVGCVGGAALAAVVLLCAQGAPVVLIAGTALGVALGRHLETGAQSRRYVGMQFTLAILVTLVPDSYANADIHPGLERLSGILIGMAILEPVLIGWHLIAPLRPAEARAEAAASPAGVDSE